MVLKLPPGTEVKPIVTTPNTTKDTKSVTVYITKTGTKYHKHGCKSLRKSKIPSILEDVKAKGLEACSICNP